MKVEEFVLEVKARADASLGRVRGQMMGLRGAALRVGGAVADTAAALVGLTVAAAKAADDLAKGARRAGLSAEDYQAFGVAFDRAGVGAGGLERAAKSLAAAQLQAQRGSAEASEAFARLGVSATDSDGRLREFGDILPDILDGLAGVESESERLALGQVVLGRAAQGMASLIKGGGEAMRETAARARVLGYAFKGPLRDSAENANDAIADVGLGIRSLAFRAVAQLIPLLEDATVGFRDFLMGIKPVIDSRLDLFMGGLVRQFRALSPEVKALAGAVGLGAVGAGLVRLGVAMGGFLTTIGLGGAVGKLRALALPLLGIAAALLAVDDVLAFARGGDSLTGRLLRYIGGEDAEETGRKALEDLIGLLGEAASTIDILIAQSGLDLPPIGQWARDAAAGLEDLGKTWLFNTVSGIGEWFESARRGYSRLNDELESGDESRIAEARRLLGLSIISQLSPPSLRTQSDWMSAPPPGFRPPPGMRPEDVYPRLGTSLTGEDPERGGFSQTINIDARGASPEQAGRIAREVGQDEAMRIFADLGVPVSVP